jgi:uncharacterized membrane protein
MGKGRLEAFSDGVIAVIITIMVLEMKPPHGSEFADLLPVLPIFLTYALSFVFIAIYWVNHHHFLHIVKHVSGGVLWANNHLLFWLSLIPFTTSWMGENHFSSWPVFTYALNLLACAIAYTICTIVVVRSEGPDSAMAKAIGKDKKGKLSLGLYLASVLIALLAPMVSCAIFVVVALIWLVPDRRIEKALQ